MPKIAQIVLGLPLEGPFDYRIPDNCQNSVRPGMRAAVSLRQRQTVGFITGFLEKSQFPKLKSIQRLLDDQPAADEAMLRLTRELAGYYGCSWGEAIEAALPGALRRRRVHHLQEIRSSTARGKPELMLYHDGDLRQSLPSVLQEIRSSLQQGYGVIVLVPEKILLGRMKNILEKELGQPCSVWDGSLSPPQELELWTEIKEGRARIVLGLRSAVFAPVRDLGLVVMFEEEHQAYKQEQSPFYHAREVALWRGQIEGCRNIFVSASPSAELWRLAHQPPGRYQYFPGTLARLQLIDLLNYKPQQKSLISFPVQTLIQETLKAQGKVVLFLNRRGFSTTTRCNQCGHTLTCPRCDVRLSYLYSKKKMCCHLCQYTGVLPKVCPQCRSSYLRSSGTGIEKLESDLCRFYPMVRIERFDRETVKVPADAGLVIATQAVVKVLDQINPQLTVVLDIDAELNRFDFRSGQRALALLVRLCCATRDKVVVQTRHRDNYALKAAQSLDFEKFYQEELNTREELGFPPFKHLVAVGLRGPKEDVVFEQARSLFEQLKKNLPDDYELLDPQPDIQPKLRDKYRFTIMLKAAAAVEAVRFVKSVIGKFERKGKSIITVNVDS